MMMKAWWYGDDDDDFKLRTLFSIHISLIIIIIIILLGPLQGDGLSHWPPTTPVLLCSSPILAAEFTYFVPPSSCRPSPSSRLSLWYWDFMRKNPAYFWNFWLYKPECVFFRWLNFFLQRPALGFPTKFLIKHNFFYVTDLYPPRKS